MALTRIERPIARVPVFYSPISAGSMAHTGAIPQGHNVPNRVSPVGPALGVQKWNSGIGNVPLTGGTNLPPSMHQVRAISISGIHNNIARVPNWINDQNT